MRLHVEPLALLAAAVSLVHVAQCAVESVWSRVHSSAATTPYATQEAKSKRHCSYLCTAEATCKSMQYNKLTSQCSLYTDEAPNLLPEENGDIVYFTSPRESLQWSTWYTVLRSTAGTGISVYDTWMATGGYNADQPHLASPESSPAGLYKSAAIDARWSSVKKVKVSVYIGGVEQFFLEFDAAGSDKSSWFSLSRLISGSVTPATYEFTINGSVCSRKFYIVTHAGCTGDWGHLIVTDALPKSTCCGWDHQANPRFLFAVAPNSIAASGMTAGEVFLIQALL